MWPGVLKRWPFGSTVYSRPFSYCNENMWVEIAVGCLFCPKSFFNYYFEYSTIPLSSKTNICFQNPISKNTQLVWEIIK